MLICLKILSEGISKSRCQASESNRKIPKDNSSNVSNGNWNSPVDWRIVFVPDKQHEFIDRCINSRVAMECCVVAFDGFLVHHRT